MFSQHKQSPRLVKPTKWYAEELTPATTTDTHEQARAEADALVEDYLDHFSAQLLALPQERRAELRREIGQHLRASAAAHEELESGAPEEAVRAAVRQFGDARTVGRNLAQQWQRDPANVSIRQFYKDALVGFSALMLLNLGLTTYFCSWPAEQQRNMLPFFWPAFMIVWVITGSPLLVGWWLGRRAPERRGTLVMAGAMATLCAGLEAATLLMAPLAEFGKFWEIPREACQWMGVYGLVCWIPLACLSGAVSARQSRRRLRRAR